MIAEININQRILRSNILLWNVWENGKKDKLESSQGEKVMLILTMNFNIEKLQKRDLLQVFQYKAL